MSDCKHGQPEWAACPKCIDEASDRAYEKIEALQARIEELEAALKWIISHHFSNLAFQHRAAERFGRVMDACGIDNATCNGCGKPTGIPALRAHAKAALLDGEGK